MTEREGQTEPGASADEKPPFGGSWRRLYALVVLTLAALIALFTWFTKAFE